ncbi:PIN domain-containing protein [Conexibacter sp. JD483]|uniref:type II toxin-antitoxin system VapC family toxin n=1 Tax=unclassified Conexibacter TaxID=2627773 RepID=UPI00271CBD63|nr:MULTISPECIES: PIN domain-containing protein [unclassified Conexibacter]MDO8186492.1 PIN domain-containing protein [Conexibacter sp. CPCC 205706]MDO8200061.1 PIN domain-containing protein [Conexibacter sp. CPCC 205762]MDR9372287.1 PIN domain-containing protein [Conexibacter sp. JD483]
MSVAWDTTLLSQVRPGSPLERELWEHARADDHVAVTAPTIMEVTRGLAARAARGEVRWQRALGWFGSLTTSGLVEVLPLDRQAAALAGHLRALHPLPPATGRRREGSRPDQRAGWVLDIQIAACAWRHGATVVTDNVRDFEALRDAIAALLPNWSPLAIRPATRAT